MKTQVSVTVTVMIHKRYSVRAYKIAQILIQMPTMRTHCPIYANCPTLPPPHRLPNCFPRPPISIPISTSTSTSMLVKAVRQARGSQIGRGRRCGCIRLRHRQCGPIHSMACISCSQCWHPGQVAGYQGHGLPLCLAAQTVGRSTDPTPWSG